MRKKWIRLLFLMIAVFGVSTWFPETSYAASSYTNAKEFYNTTGTDKPYRVETHNASIYYASKGKLASSSSNLKYRTVGYDVRLEAGGASVSFTVKRGDSLKEIHKMTEAGYEYILYEISTETIYNLASKADAESARKIFAQPNITVYMDAIQVTLRNGQLHGNIYENGSGGFTQEGTIYRMNNAADVNRLMSIFYGHTFETDYMIKENLTNYGLNIYYCSNGGNVGGAYSAAVFGNLNDVLYKNGNIYYETVRTFETANITNASTFGLSKKGYHLDAGSEWVSSNNLLINESSNYAPKEIHSEAGLRNINIIMKANWKPNTYTINYHANGGNGTIASSHMTYDVVGNIKINSFTRVGYRLKTGAEWNTKPDGSGTSYMSGQTVLNLLTEHGSELTLYAMWEPEEYPITIHKDGGNGGDDVFYELYDSHFFNTANKTISSIGTPIKVGHTFAGYYLGHSGYGEQIVDDKGIILINPNYFVGAANIVANWLRNQYTITFDKMGGTEGIGTDSVKVYYGDLYPFATAPVKPGYSFKGYFADKEYTDMAYTENMSPTKVMEMIKDVTVYAKWVDDVLPVSAISVSSEEWTNRSEGVEVTASAYDYGTGLDYIELYCGDTFISSKTDLNGAISATIDYTHTQEGVYRYRTIAYDMNGNTHESYANVQYDIKAPTGNYNISNATLNNFGISIHASDYNIQ